MHNSPAKNNSNKSCLLTFSFGVNKEAIQNNTAAPIILIDANEKPETPASIAAFPTGARSPHMHPATNNDR